MSDDFDTTLEETGPVLVVDDEPAIMKAILRALTQSGLKAEGVNDGLAAAALIRERSFDVIVSDIAMPGMDGVTLLKTVREHDPDVPVILVTGTPALETAVEAVHYGAMRYILKPFDVNELTEAVLHAQRVYKLARLRRHAISVLGAHKQQISDRLELEASFERALSTLWVAGQPIIAYQKKEIYAFEALVRCSEPAFPHPGALLGAAEQLGRLHDLGRMIREKAALAIVEAPCKFVFVNLHTQDLLDEELYSPEAPLSQIGSQVVLEITERASLDEVRDVRNRVALLRKLGFRIAIDDLGAGYAGLASFTQLEPDVVKLDISLIRGIHKSPIQRQLVTSMTKLCHELGLIVVAEGVEEPEERDVLLTAGCDYLQGFLFARPGNPLPDVTW